MGIAKLKHISLFCAKDNKDNLLYIIQKLGIIHLVNLSEPQQSAQKDSDTQLLDKIQDAIDYFNSIPSGGKPNKHKKQFNEKELQSFVKNIDTQSIVNKLNKIRDRIKAIDIEHERLSVQKHTFIPWSNLKTPISKLAPTHFTESFIGTINPKQTAHFEEDARIENLNIFVDVINQTENFMYILIIAFKEDINALVQLAKKHHIAHIAFPKTEGTIENMLSELDNHIKQLEAEKRSLIKEAGGFVDDKLKLMALADVLNNKKSLKHIGSSIFNTDYVSLITGWVKEKDIPKLHKHILSMKDVEVIIRNPKPGEEEVPVELENKNLIKPFEFITKIYGMPKYNELDPTPYLAPFFFLYFGFCVSDVGYGLILAVFTLFAMKKLKLGENIRQCFRLFFFCAISTIVAGALTGSWFGNLIDVMSQSNDKLAVIKHLKDKMVILDPMQNPTKLLAIMLAFGIVQVWFGNIVAIIGNIKNKRYLDILFDQGSMLLFLFGITGMVFTAMGIAGKELFDLFKYCSIAGAIALILTQGRTEKTIGSKLFFGGYNLYNAVSGYLSDILSFSRLWALGLVTGAMATTINLISVQLSDIIASAIPVVNKFGFSKTIVSCVIMLLIFVFGHLFSFLMNLLGAFVHPLRLQFVEFFSKFFKPGGNALKPFKIETKYIDIINN